MRGPSLQRRVRGAACLLVPSALVACAVDERAPDVITAPAQSGTSAPPSSTNGNMPGASEVGTNGSTPGATNVSDSSAAGSGGRAAEAPPACAEGSCGEPPALMPSGATLRLNVRGDGLGSVAIGAPGQSEQECLEACSVSVDPGTELTLTASPGLNSALRGWSVPSCGSSPRCTVRVDSDTTVEVSLELAFNVAFVTSQVYAAASLPRAGAEANQECARLAAAAGLHGSRFVAWLSAEGATPDEADDIVPADFFQHRGGWVRSDGEPVARSLAALTRGELLHPILLDEQRNAFASSQSWSSTSVSGRLARSVVNGSVSNCLDWSSDDATLTGVTVPTAGTWLGDGNAMFCSAMNTLLCLGDDSDAEVPVPATAGRLAFLSQGSFTASGGLSGADALCQREACQAGLTGSASCNTDPGSARIFKAYLHTSAQPAWQRFNLSGLPWLRVDGVQWLPDAADLATDASHRLTGLNVRLDSSYGQPQLAWVGDPAGAATCRDWTSASDADRGVFASTYLTSSMGLGGNAGSQSCVLAEGRNYLFCLED